MNYCLGSSGWEIASRDGVIVADSRYGRQRQRARPSTVDCQYLRRDSAMPFESRYLRTHTINTQYLARTDVNLGRTRGQSQTCNSLPVPVQTQTVSCLTNFGADERWRILCRSSFEHQRSSLHNCHLNIPDVFIIITVICTQVHSSSVFRQSNQYFC